MGIILALSISVALALKNHKKMEETFALSIMLISLVIYFCGMAVPLSYATMIVNIASVFCLILILWLLLFRKVQCDRIDMIYGILIVCFFILFMMFFCEGRDVSSPDGYYCWGWMTKGFYYTDSLRAGYANGLTANHPPFTTLWYYYVLKTWLCFSDGMCIFANNILMIALLLPVISFFDNKNKYYQVLIAVAIIFLVPYIGDTFAYTTIMVDHIQGGLTLYSAICLCKLMERTTQDKNFYFFSFIVAIQCLTLSKRSGFIFSSIFLTIFVALCIANNTKQHMLVIVVSILVSLITIVSWFGVSKYALLPICSAVAGLGVGYAMKNSESLFKRKEIRTLVFALPLITILVAISSVFKMDEYSRLCCSSYLYDLFSIYDKSHGIKSIPFGYWIIAVFALAFIKCHINNKRNKENTFFYLGIGAGMILYSIALLYLHITDIGPANQYTTHIISRYYIPFIICVLGMICVEVIQSTLLDDFKKTIVLCSILVVLLLSSEVSNFFESFFIKNQNMNFYAFDKAGIELTSNDCIYFVDEVDDNTYRDREFYYSVYPAKTNFVYSDILDSQGVGKLPYNLEEFASILKDKYNYVYLQTIDKDFIREYKELFLNEEDISQGHIYRVDESHGDVKLVLIENR